MKSSRATSRRGCSIPAHFAELDRGTILIPDQFLATSAIAPTPVGFAPRTCSRPSAWCRARMRRTIPCSGKRRRRRAEEGRERGDHAAEHPLGRGLRAPAQRHQLLRLPSDPRHRRLSFPRRRLDGGQALQFDRRAGLAAFLRRPGPPPRHPHRVARRQAAGFLARLCQPSASCAAARNSPAPNMRTAGARIAMSSTPTPPTTTRVSSRGPAPRGWPARSRTRRRGWGCVSSK